MDWSVAKTVARALTSEDESRGTTNLGNEGLRRRATVRNDRTRTQLLVRVALGDVFPTEIKSSRLWTGSPTNSNHGQRHKTGVQLDLGGALLRHEPTLRHAMRRVVCRLRQTMDCR